MSEPIIRWKIHVKSHDAEVEVVGLEKDWVKGEFAELAKKYIFETQPEAVSAL